MNPWPHQDRAHNECRRLYAGGAKRWCLVAPCGAGKSLMMRRLAAASEKGLNVFIYTHRILLTAQTIAAFEAAGLEFGVIGAGFTSRANPQAKIQICSLDTVGSRMDKWNHDMPIANIVIIDEAHQQTAATAQKVFGRHAEQGARIIGFTATPVGLGPMNYEKLVIAGTYSEMLECKAHLPIVCYGPDRPDTSQLKAMKGGDFSSEDDRRINRVPTIIGRVYDYWQKLNPCGLPAIGFAPGVAESKWFVEEFRARGVACAHIDAERVLMTVKGANGVLQTHEYTTDEDSRKAVLEGSRTGEFKIVWNRFVLREAIDMPWLYHAISATSMGAVSTYLQSIGRVQRYWPEYQNVILQDHGGNIDRHGTPDIDRQWELGCTNNSVHKAEIKERERKKGDEAEPICCPKCCAYRTAGQECHNCGYMHSRSVRMVRQLDGELVKKVGREVKYKAAKTFEDYLRSAIYGGYASGQTVKQAYKVAQIRAAEHGVATSATSIQMPLAGSEQWHRSVREVYPWARPKQMRTA